MSLCILGQRAHGAANGRWAKVLFLVLLCLTQRLAARDCPASCPLLADPVTGAESRCCSIGDSAAGCGLCDDLTCSLNGLPVCGDLGELDCATAGAGCSVVRAVTGCTRTLAKVTALDFTKADLADLSGIEALTLQGAAAADYLGYSVSSVGDVNGNGYVNLIVGAPYASPNGRSAAGAAYLIFGRASGFATVDFSSFVSGDSTGFIIQGAQEDDRLGLSISGAGDVNGDGYADLIVGAPLADPNGRSLAGAAYVIFGQASGFTTLDLLGLSSSDSTGYIIQGAAAGGYLGYSVSGAGDVNGDGDADLVVGAPYADPNGISRAGAAYIIFGQKSGFATVDMLGFVSGDSTGFIIQGAAAGDQLGFSVSGAGDVNSDGYADLV
ncbi:hypothetical protein B484DRAFT_394502 [Ochromonadaceae sp. CCMP2298]|nr:hypothetical protein B484DRAFT_394502 [Ochromonadaceae sp. CCMP2298]